MSEPTTLLLLRTAGPLAPLRRTALWLTGLSGWRRLAAAFVLGALAAGALPPVDVTPVLIVSFSGLVWLADGSTRGRDALALGWSFGFGFFVAGLYWIGAAMLVDAAEFWWLVPFAVLGLPACFALYTAIALWLSYETCRRLRLGGSARILVLALAWVAAEWARGHALTGFPWNLVGYAWSGAFPGGLWMLQITAYTGIYGLSLITVLAAALPARLGDLAGRRWVAAAAAVLLVALPAAGGAWRVAQYGRDMVPHVMLRLVQPSMPVTMGSSAAVEAANLEREVPLSRSPGAERMTAVIWAEGMAPSYLALPDRGELRRILAAAAPPAGLLIAGSTRTDAPPDRPGQHFWNSLVALDDEGDIVGTYDKAHLVPFGEFVPLSRFIPIEAIATGVGFSAGTGPRTLRLPGLPPVGPLICYEAIFPGEVVDPADRPKWLLNVTEDGWYGVTSGPFQHVAIARVRAVEEGLPLVRVGNNGVSAVIDASGRVLAHLGLNAVGVLDSELPTAFPPTLYSEEGDRLFLAMLIAVFGAALALGRIATRSREVKKSDFLTPFG